MAQRPTLSPEITAWQARDRELKAGLPDITSPDDDRRRAAEVIVGDTLAREFTLPVDDDAVEITEVVIGPDEHGLGNHALTVTRVRPRLEGPLGASMYFHGGAFISGRGDSVIDTRLAAGRAAATGVEQWSVHYRLAPRYPFPAAIDDGIAALSHAAAHADELGLDPDRLGVSGVSAGATIAAAITLRVRDEGGPAIAHQSLEVPVVSFLPDTESARDFAPDGGRAVWDVLPVAYWGSPDWPHDNPYFQPSAASDLSHLPPGIVRVAEYDALRDAGLAYGRRMQEAGVDVVVECGAGQLHGTASLTARAAASREWQASIAANQRRWLG